MVRKNANVAAGSVGDAEFRRGVAEWMRKKSWQLQYLADLMQVNISTLSRFMTGKHADTIAWYFRFQQLPDFPPELLAGYRLHLVNQRVGRTSCGGKCLLAIEHEQQQCLLNAVDGVWINPMTGEPVMEGKPAKTWTAIMDHLERGPQETLILSPVRETAIYLGGALYCLNGLYCAARGKVSFPTVACGPGAGQPGDTVRYAPSIDEQRDGGTVLITLHYTEKRG